MYTNELYISGVNYESFVDGQGVRAAIFLSGCSHNCPGCHNPEAQDPCCGTPSFELIDTICREIAKRPFLQGITLTGGDPLYNPYQTDVFLSCLSARLSALGQAYNKDVWLYTGYTWEQLMSDANPHIDRILHVCDVLVDGPFIQSLADRTLAFRGSSNQRVIDVQRSLAKGKVVLWKTDSY